MLTFKTLKPLFTHLALFLPILFNPRNGDLGNKPNLFLSARSRVFIFSQNIYFLYWKDAGINLEHSTSEESKHVSQQHKASDLVCRAYLGGL